MRNNFCHAVFAAFMGARLPSRLSARLSVCLAACFLFAAFPSPVVAKAEWTVAHERSAVTYLSTKMTGAFATVFEHNRFKHFSGGISAAGEVTLDIDLDSVDTGVAIRDERVRKHVFDTGNHPRATVRLTIKDLPKRSDGQVRTVEAALTMRGVTRPVNGELSIAHTDDGLLVQTTAPILVNAADYGMAEGFETLKGLVKLFNIPTTIPVSLNLVFVKK